MTAIVEAPPLMERVTQVVRVGVERVRATAAMGPLAWQETWGERGRGHPADVAHGPHLEAAIAWLCRAQDAIGTGGIARGYGLANNSDCGGRGWQPAYPETTGYIIPTLYFAARQLGRVDLARRAEKAARWELTVQLESGAIRGGVVDQQSGPAVFNTGQVILGWLRASAETGDSVFEDAARRAGQYLISVLDADGIWRRGNSRFAHPDATLYNARAAWALAVAGARCESPAFTAGAKMALAAVVRQQHTNGWFPHCCLTDPEHPLVHTPAYTTRGLLEGGVLLRESRFIAAAVQAASAMANALKADGSLPGRFDANWDAAARWSCLTGMAQMANIWLRLYEITGARRWLDPATRVLRFLKVTQNRTSGDGGLRGGIKGSFPVSGDYGRHQVLSWATKFFADALLRHDRMTGTRPLFAGADALV